MTKEKSGLPCLKVKKAKNRKSIVTTFTAGLRLTFETQKVQN